MASVIGNQSRYLSPTSSVNISTVALLLAADNDRAKATFQNNDASDRVTIGFSNTITDGVGGVMLEPGEKWEYYGRKAVYAIAETGTTPIGVTVERGGSNQIKTNTMATVSVLPTITKLRGREDRRQRITVVNTHASLRITVGDANALDNSAGIIIPAGKYHAFTSRGPIYAISPAGTNEVQTVTISATGGTFTLTYAGQTTAAIAFNAAASLVQTRLEDLSNIAVGDVTVTGSNGGPYTITFTGALAATNVAQMTSNAASLTGGSGTATVATQTPGVSTIITATLLIESI